MSFDKLAPTVQNRITTLESDVSDLRVGVALAMAMANAPIVLDGDKKFSISVGLGFYDSEAAGSVKAAMKLGQNGILTGSAAFSDNETAAGVGVGFGF